jgi:hypothetical protein
MSIRLQLRFRAIMSALSGIVLLILAADVEFFHSRFDAWATLVNFFIALFGVAFLLQSWRLVKQLREDRSKVLVEQLQEARTK